MSRWSSLLYSHLDLEILPVSARPVGLALRHPGGRSSKPPRGKFLDRRWRSLSAGWKKITSLVPCTKHSWSGPVFITGNGPLCTGGVGVQGFSRLAWENLLLSVMLWGQSSPAGLVFFYLKILDRWNVLCRWFSLPIVDIELYIVVGLPKEPVVIISSYHCLYFLGWIFVRVSSSEPAMNTRGELVCD